MPHIITTTEVDLNNLDQSRKLAVYCGLDCCITKEIADRLREQIATSDYAGRIYTFARALRSPVMEMQLRGIKVDENERTRAISNYGKKRDLLKGYLNGIIEAYLGWLPDSNGWRLNPSSPQKLKYFYYGIGGLTEQKTFKKGESTVGVNKDALKKFQEEAPFPFDYVSKIILSLRDINKTIGALKAGVEKNGRMKFSYSIAGTITGRFSSSKNIYSRGANSQNWNNRLRRIFVADEGRKLGYFDLSGAEARVVAYESEDLKYIEANEGALKVHTYVAKLVWPDLPWPGTPQGDTTFAEKYLFHGKSIYSLSKVIQHLSNYWGAPSVMAKSTGLPIGVAKEFQEQKYYGVFTGISQWHSNVVSEIQSTHTLTTAFGRKRRFFKRTSDHTTMREAIAFGPQSAIGDLLNLAMYRLWCAYDPVGFPVRVLSQLHDAVLLDYPEAREEELLPRVLQIMTIPFTLKGRKVLIPVDAKVGWNWEEVKAADLSRNPDGLMGWKPEKPDLRSRHFPAKVAPHDLILW